MKLTVRSALEMLQALAQLDGYQNGSDKLSPYKMDGPTRIAVAIARRHLRSIADDYQEARNGLIKQLSGGLELPQMTGVMAEEERREVIELHWKFNEANRALLLAEVEVNLRPVAVASLELNENPIPPSVLEMLGDFITMEG